MERASASASKRAGSAMLPIVMGLLILVVIVWLLVMYLGNARVDCQLDCGSWSACSGPVQSRVCTVTTVPQGNGAPCGDLFQTQPCPSQESADCVPGVPDPNAWSACPSCVPQDLSTPPMQLQMVPPLVSASGAGRPCSWTEIFRTRPCATTVPSCPKAVDCQVSPAPAYTTPCTAQCGGGVQYAVTPVAVPPQGGGAACDWSSIVSEQPCNTQACARPENCAAVYWPSEWSACSAVCGADAFQYQTRLPQGANDSCPLIQTQSCHAPACLGDPSVCRAPTADEITRVCYIACSAKAGAAGVLQSVSSGTWTLDGEIMCGVGSATVASICGSSITQGICPAPQDCTVGAWSNWSSCTQASCDAAAPTGGVQYRSRTIVSPAVGGGSPCPALLQTRPCNNLTPVGSFSATCVPVDCSLSAWTTVSGCSADCGGGVAMMFRNIVASATGGGQPCPIDPGSYLQTTPCNSTPCQTCTWMDWDTYVVKYGDNWSTCSSACNGQMQQGPRPLLQPAARGICDPSDAYRVQSCCVDCKCNACPLGCGNLECSGHGSCVGGKCVCQGGWGGEACELTCPVGDNGLTCNGLGSCTGSATCACEGEASGPTCATGANCFLKIYRTGVAYPGQASCSGAALQTLVGDIRIQTDKTFPPVACSQLNGWSNGYAAVVTTLTGQVFPGYSAASNWTTQWAAFAEQPDMGLGMTSAALAEFGAMPYLLSQATSVMLDGAGVTARSMASANVAQMQSCFRGSV